MNKKLIASLILLFIATICHAATFPLNNAFLQTDMNGNQKKITNLLELDVTTLNAASLTVSSTNFGLNITNLPLTATPLPYFRFPFANTNTGSNGAIRYDDMAAAISLQAVGLFQGIYNVVISTNFTTAQIQAALDSNTNNGVVGFQTGTYNITTNISITNGGIWICNNSTFVFGAGLTNFMFDTGTNFQKNLQIYNGNFYGGIISTYSDTNHFQTTTPGQHFPFLNPCWTNRSALRVEASKGVRVAYCEFSGWPGNGCLALAVDGTFKAQHYRKFEFLFNRCYTNFIGVIATAAPWEVPGYFNSDSSTWLGNAAPEYALIEGNDCFENQMGIVASAGNCLVQGNTINNNWIALAGFAGGNGEHGRYCGNTMNHNTMAIYMEAQALGGMFQDNAILANGQVVFNNVIAVNFNNNNISQTALVFTNGTTGSIFNNSYEFNAVWGDTNALTGLITNFSPIVPYAGNHSTDGTNNDGTALSLIMHENALAQPTNIPPAAANAPGEMMYWNSNGANLYLLKSSAGSKTWSTTNLIN